MAMSMITEVVTDIAAGNPGAVTAVMETLTDESLPVELRTDLLPGLLLNKIRGPEVWLLYKDVCGKDNLKFATIVAWGFVSSRDKTRDVSVLKDLVQEPCSPLTDEMLLNAVNVLRSAHAV